VNGVDDSGAESARNDVALAYRIRVVAESEGNTPGCLRASFFFVNSALTTYLNDHLAGSDFAVDLLKALAEQDIDRPLGSFAMELRSRVEEDRAVLERLVERTGPVRSTLKEMTAWLAEKGSRFKLTWAADRELGTFEALEAVSLGVSGKLALWRALQAVAAYDPCLAGVDFDELAKRAKEQHGQIEEQRLQAATVALVGR